MQRKRLFWQLYPSYLFIVIITLIAVSGYASFAIKNFFLEQTSSELEATARILQTTLGQSKNPQQIDDLCKHLGNLVQTRITYIQANGNVVGDSKELPKNMDSHANRPEIQAALSGIVGQSTRYSQTLQRDMMYVAIPVYQNNQIVAIIRTSISNKRIQKTLYVLYTKIFVGGLFISFLAMGIGYIISLKITKPIEEMKEAAKLYAQGNLDHKLSLPNSAELASLAETLNEMALQMDERLREEVRQSNEREAILSSMVEGVLAVDTEKRIININAAARKFLNVNRQEAMEKSLPELIRSTELKNFIQQSLESTTALESEITIPGDQDHYLQLHGSVLVDANNQRIGALIVFNDVTRLRQLEEMRSEFVANVSHELKTPITSIKGFVETLADGAVENREDAARFLNIISKQTNRLNAIIEDLLSLSRIEQDENDGEIHLQITDLNSIIRSAVQICEPKSKAKDLEVIFNGNGPAQSKINPQLMEQAIVNLIDNAIKHTPTAKKIELQLEQSNADLKLTVKDEGCGIAPEHLPRLFERFYRVDKSRSRELGGTGLGLAIVKHIVMAHGGSVAVFSKLGQGTAFEITLPNQ